MTHPSRPLLRYALAGALAALPPAARCEIVLDTPVGGWRHSGGEATGFRQKVNYPASSVNIDGQPDSAQIRGRIASQAKSTGKADDIRQPRASEAPATLIANGLAMPLAVEPDGTFARPYAFGQGGNSIEVRANGESRKVAFYDSYAGRTQSRLRVVLAWDSPNTDLDLHVVSPDGQHVFYGNRVAENGGALDVDVTTGFGPEIYASPSPPNGVYSVFVNYYGGGSYGQDGEHEPQERDADVVSLQQELTVATITVTTQENTLGEKMQTFRVPMRRAGELTLVKSFSYP